LAQQDAEEREPLDGGDFDWASLPKVLRCMVLRSGFFNRANHWPDERARKVLGFVSFDKFKKIDTDFLFGRERWIT